MTKDLIELAKDLKEEVAQIKPEPTNDNLDPKFKNTIFDPNFFRYEAKSANPKQT